MTQAYDIRIYGHVFNVGFRRYVHRYAVECNIVGYVENDHTDGSVHIIAEGQADKLDRFAILCGEGTPYSMVTDIKTENLQATGAYTDFQQIR